MTIAPGLQAVLNQEDAELRFHLDVLIETYRGMVAQPETGERQAACNLVAFIPTEYDEVAVAGLLMTAIRRLTAEGKAS